MDAALWASVARVLADSPGRSHDDGAVGTGGIARTRALDYGAYTDLVLAHPADGELPESVKAEAEAYLRTRLGQIRDAIADHPIFDGEPGIPSLSTLSRSFYCSTEIERLRRWWDIEPENALRLMAVSDDLFGRASVDLSCAFDRMRQCSVELYRETVETIYDIVIAKPDSSERLALGGVSSFALWGAFAINPETHDEDGWVHYYKTIVHEAGHNVLFAFARDEPLVKNHPDEKYRSPLRSDPRPMDGIFHAAFVSARESLALDSLLEWHEETHSLSAAEIDLAQRMFEDSVIGFWQCVEALRPDALLTPLGDAILNECESFMTDRFTLVTG